MWGGHKVSNIKPNNNYNEDVVLDIVSVHHIHCPQCRAVVIPQLHIRCYEKHNTASSTVNGENNDNLKLKEHN